MSPRRTSTPRPWGAYALRLLCSLLMFASGFALLAGSTFAMRMRPDVPGFVPGLSGPQSIALVLAAVLSLLPLLLGRRYLGALVVSAFLLSGLGAYWWTTVPWDELITASNFPTSQKPRLMDYALVASPAVIAGFYAVVSHASVLRADLRRRGAEREQAMRASCASFLAGAGLLVLGGAMTVGLWTLMASGAAFGLAPAGLRGVPAIIVASALVAVAYALVMPRTRGGATLRRPWSAAARLAALARSRAQRSPS